jgi:lactoylglutathione lyase
VTSGFQDTTGDFRPTAAAPRRVSVFSARPLWWRRYSPGPDDIPPRQKPDRANHPREPRMKYLHTMVRVTDVDKSIAFYKELGLNEVRRIDNEKGRYTLYFLAAPGDEDAQVELTFNWDPEVYGEGRNFGHLAYRVDDIYALCDKLQKAGIVINRPPRDGHMAFIRSPDNISVELIQAGDPLPPQEPWASMPNTGKW